MLKLLSLVLLLYFGLGGLLYFFQRSFIYFPVSRAANGLAEVFIESSDGFQLQGLVANGGQQSVLFYFGGNAEQISYSLSQLSVKLPSTTLVGFYYRGYGGSEGEPSEKALFADALEVYDKLAREYREVIVMGRSLGSGVATYLATRRAVERLILVTPFDSIARVAQGVYWFYPVHWLLWDKYESFKIAERLDSEILVLIAELDKTVRFKYSQNLVQHLPKGRFETKIFPNVGHNNIESANDYYATISQFLSQAPSQ